MLPISPNEDENEEETDRDADDDENDKLVPARSYALLKREQLL